MARKAKKSPRRKVKAKTNQKWLIPVLKDNEVLKRGSFAVNYVRSRDIGYGGDVQRNRHNPSPRRFASKRDALHHGVRFVQIEGHNGFYLTRVSDRPNAVVNWKTGKTNPVIGQGRTNR